MYKTKNWIKLALEAEIAITQLRIFEQDYIHYQVAHNIKRLYKQKDENTYNTTCVCMCVCVCIYIYIS
jgi:hypothetical protein